MKYIVDDQHDGERLDKFLAVVSDLSRSQVQSLIKQGKAKVYGEYVKKPGFIVKAGDPVYFYIPPKANDDLKGEEMPLEILYEDKYIIVLNKPASIVVHPAVGNKSGTIANGLKHYLENNTDSISGFERVKLVHRLDKDTSGVLVVAKSDEVHASLSNQWKKRKVKKLYIVLLAGHVKPDRGEIHAPIARDPNDRQKMKVAEGRPSYTIYKVLEYVDYPKMSLVKTRIITGRTHQIRVHFSSIDYPVVGDSKYNKHVNAIEVPRQMLHAACIEFEHPVSKKQMLMKAPIPKDMMMEISKYNLEENENWYTFSDFN